MLHTLRLYGTLAAASIKSQMQHRASFLMESIANFLSSATDIVGIWVLVDRFSTIQGWTLQELALIYGIIPITLFPTAFRLAFTCVIPLSCVAYYPVATILHHETFPLWIAVIAPCAGASFLFLACRFWHVGVRRYHSTGN